MGTQDTTKLSKILSLCRRRGFLFPSSEIYGGLASCWDYGPLGAQMKTNIKKLWWNNMTRRLNVVGIDTSIFMHPKVWEASGHIDGFTDPLSDCRACKRRFSPSLNLKKCPECGSLDITPARNFNLMFKSSMGPVEDEGSQVWLRPETAQGIYVNFLNVMQTGRHKLPIGIAQIGKAFRNEITPSHFLFRMREFEQMEMQFFTPPQRDKKYFSYWRQERQNWLLSLGLKEGDLHFHTHKKEELAHYALYAEDIEYSFPEPLGKQELEGLHMRGDFDLSRHETFSKKKLKFFDADKKTSYLPHVIETSIGCDRLFLSVLCSAYQEETMENGEVRVLLDLAPDVAPVRLAVLPLQKKPQILDIALQLQQDLSEDHLVAYDDAGSIGKRYRRQDEIGTPFCATVDFQTLEDGKVTVRRRDILEQLRIPLTRVRQFLNDREAFRDPSQLGVYQKNPHAGPGEVLCQSPSTKALESVKGREDPSAQGKKQALPTKAKAVFPLPESFYLPALKFIAKQAVGLDQITEHFFEHFKLWVQQKQELSLGGSQTKLYNRGVWAVSHLKRLGFIERACGLWHITPVGKAFLFEKNREDQEDFLKELIQKSRQGFIPLPLSVADLEQLAKKTS